MRIKATRNLGMMLLGIWLLITGLVGLLSLSFAGLGPLMALIALAAGILILLGRYAWAGRRNGRETN
jgi:hypothetical protein